MEWTIVEAKKKLSQVIRAAEEEPQWLCNHGRLVAVVVEPGVFAEFLAWQRERRTSIDEVFSELRKLCAEEGYTLDIPSRSSDS